MAETLAGPSGLTRQHLPSAQTADIGKYLKIDANGNPVWYYETPGGTVTEAGASAANSIGADSGADISEKLTNLVNDATETLAGKIEIATSAEATAGTDDTKALTPKKFADALEAGQIITTTLAVDGGFAATNYGSTEAISGGTANG